MHITFPSLNWRLGLQAGSSTQVFILAPHAEDKMIAPSRPAVNILLEALTSLCVSLPMIMNPIVQMRTMIIS